MMTLYGKQGSGSASVEIALALVGAQYRPVETARWEPGTGWDDLVKVNPLGQVPTLVLDDGTAVSESAAIMIHLADAHPDKGLLPSAPSARAHAIRGLVFVAANCYPMITIIDYPERFCAGAEHDDALQERIRRGTRARLHAHWEMFADVFPATPWLSGERLGALDLYAATVSKWSGARKHLEAARPALFATLQRIDAHPAVAPVFERHWPPKA